MINCNDGEYREYEGEIKVCKRSRRQEVEEVDDGQQKFTHKSTSKNAECRH